MSEFGSLGGGFCPGEPMPESGAGAEGSFGAGALGRLVDAFVATAGSITGALVEGDGPGVVLP